MLQALGERFVPFYASFMPAVLGLISDSSISAAERGKAIEAAGFIGVAVGKERFTSDGVTLVRSMLAFGVTSEHEEYGYVQQTLARVAGCIGEPFLPFLPSVIPACKAKAKATIPGPFVRSFVRSSLCSAAFGGVGGRL